LIIVKLIIILCYGALFLNILVTCFVSFCPKA